MYDYFEGRIASLEGNRVVVDVGGIGYILQISSQSSARLIKVRDRARVLAHLVVVDGEPRLYGFAEPGERELFRLLTSVSGVGPSTALQLLSSMAPREIARAISGGSEATLRSVKGIGAKTAGRLVVELKDSIAKLGIEFTDTPPDVRDAREALLALGFKPVEADRLTDAAHRAQPAATSEELIKLALAASRNKS